MASDPDTETLSTSRVPTETNVFDAGIFVDYGGLYKLFSRVLGESPGSNDDGDGPPMAFFLLREVLSRLRAHVETKGAVTRFFPVYADFRMLAREERAIPDEVEDVLKEAGFAPQRVAGTARDRAVPPKNAGLVERAPERISIDAIGFARKATSFAEPRSGHRHGLADGNEETGKKAKARPLVVVAAPCERHVALVRSLYGLGARPVVALAAPPPKGSQGQPVCDAYLDLLAFLPPHAAIERKKLRHALKKGAARRLLGAEASVDVLSESNSLWGTRQSKEGDGRKRRPPAIAPSGDRKKRWQANKDPSGGGPGAESNIGEQAAATAAGEKPLGKPTASGQGSAGAAGEKNTLSGSGEKRNGKKGASEGDSVDRRPPERVTAALDEENFGEVRQEMYLRALRHAAKHYGQYDEIYLTPLLRSLTEAFPPHTNPKHIVSALEESRAVALTKRPGEPHNYTVLILNPRHPAVRRVTGKAVVS